MNECFSAASRVIFCRIYGKSISKPFLGFLISGFFLQNIYLHQTSADYALNYHFFFSPTVFNSKGHDLNLECNCVMLNVTALNSAAVMFYF